MTDSYTSTPPEPVGPPSEESASDKAGAAASAVQDGVGQVASSAQQKAGDVKNKATGEAKSVVSDARDQASQVVGTARTQLRSQAADQTDRLAETLSQVGRQLSQMADGADDPESGVTRLVRGAADQADSTARRLTDGGLDTLVGDVTRVARNRPALFLIGSVAAGFAVGRLARHLDLGELGQSAKEAAQPAGETAASPPDDSMPIGSPNPQITDAGLADDSAAMQPGAPSAFGAAGTVTP